MIITLEGADRSGKNTQALRLAARLRDGGLSVEMFSFPGYHTETGRRIAGLLEAGGRDGTLHVLMAKNRLESLEDILRAYSTCDVLIMDRYVESNVVYGMANGMDRRYLESLDGRMPPSDSVILLDSDTSILDGRSGNMDSIERNSPLMEEIARRYRDEALRGGWHVVRGGMTIEETHAAVFRCAVLSLGAARARRA